MNYPVVQMVHMTQPLSCGEVGEPKAIRMRVPKADLVDPHLKQLSCFDLPTRGRLGFRRLAQQRAIP